LAEDFIARNAVWRFAKGITPASSPDAKAWRLSGFNDQSWSTGNAPFFYGEALSGTELVDMRGAYTSLFLRREFNVRSVSEIESLTLKAISDDGFIAWINGVEVARFNVPEGELTHDSAALAALAEPLPLDSYPIPNPASVLRPGTNVLALHAFNASLSGSSDFVLDPVLEFTRDLSAPTLERVLPVPGAAVRALSSIEVLFSEPVQGVDAADLLVNNLPATRVQAVSAEQYVFTLPPLTTGPVAVRFRDGHGITDLSPVPHAFISTPWSLALDPSLSTPSLVINEFLADNKRGLKDSDGDSSDWIEMFNASSESQSLAGWTLSDDPLSPKRWALPALSINPASFLLVFASGKDRNTNPAEPHTNFKLTSESGGFLGLYDPTGLLVSAFTNYPAQRTDISYGRAGGAPNKTGYFVTPTPRSANSDNGPGFAPPVIFNESSRTFLSAIAIRLTTTNSLATIRYTTDGSIPTESSSVFPDEFAFGQALQIRARAFQPGLLPGPIRSETFIPLSNPVATQTSDLPILIIHDFGKGRPPANSDTFAHVQLYEPNTNGITYLTNAPTVSSRTQIASRGSSTEGYSKVSLKMEFQDELGSDRKVSLLGLPSDSDFVLYAPNNFEPILIHNPLAYQLSRDIGRYAPRTRFVEVYLVQSGLGPVAQSSYNGIYALEEKIKISDDRVEGPELNVGQNTPPQVTGGYLLKIDRADPGDSGFSSGSQQVLYVDPKEPDLERPERALQRAYINSFIQRFDTALRSAAFRDPTNGYAAYIHPPAWIDHHLINVIAFNVDALRLSAYFHKPREGKLEFGPVWDFDRALNSTDGRDSNPRVWRSTSGDQGTDFFNYPWWGRLFQDPDFYQAYIDRYQGLRKDIFSNTNLAARVDFFANQVRKAQPREQARWGVAPRGGYQGEVDSLKRWLSNRLDFIDRQFVAPPTFAEPGRQVPAGYALVLNAPVGASLYYTLDGSDPRAQGSATGSDLAPNAELYLGPVVLRQNARVTVRSRNTAHSALTGANNPPLKSIWSAPVSETFVVKPFTLTVSEIMFHPSSDGTETEFNSKDFEFIELLNYGTNTVNLVGVELRGDIEFRFTATNSIQSLKPAERLILVRNRAAFALRYPKVSNVEGPFSGTLDNNGGRLALRGPLREPILDFRFEEAWIPATDGTGRSLVLIQEGAPTTDLGLAASWRASNAVGGSPGRFDEPVRVAPRLSFSLSATTLSLLCVGEPGRIHRLETADQLPSKSWIILDRATTPANGRLDFLQPRPTSQRYFRIVQE